MDLIDILRIAARRWYVVLFILVVGGTAAFALASSVEPEYKVESQGILIAALPSPEAAEQVTGPTNPFLSFSSSLFTTLSAVTRTVNGDEYRAELLAELPESDYTFSTSQEAPVVITEATSQSPEAATELAAAVQSAISATLVNLQAEEGVPADEQIFMRVLTTSDPVKEQGSRNRVLIGMLGITVAAAVGGAALFDALASMRRKRKAGGARTDDVSDEGEESSETGEPQKGADSRSSKTGASNASRARGRRSEEKVSSRAAGSSALDSKRATSEAPSPSRSS